MTTPRLPFTLAAVAAAASLLLTACGGGDISSGAPSASGGSGAPAACTGTMKLAVNPWVGYEASAYVVGEVAKQKLGCEVAYQNLKEEVSWQGFAKHRQRGGERRAGLRRERGKTVSVIGQTPLYL